MAKAKPSAAAQDAINQANADAASGKPATTDAVPLKPAVVNAQIPTDKQIAAKEKVDAAAAKKAEADKARADKAELAATKKTEADAIKAKNVEDRAAKKAERQARLDQLAAGGKSYTGPMLALADRAKTGHYVTGATGQLRSTDELAVALDGVSPTDVVTLGLNLLKLEDNPYVNLNIGQQSMNLRNRMRGAIRKETLKISDIADYISRNKVHVITSERLAELAKEKAEKKAASQEAKAKTAANKAEVAEKAKAAKPVAEAGTASQVDLAGK